VGSDLNPKTAEAIGKAFGTILVRGEKNSDSGTVVVGRDVRQSSPSLSEALIEGVVSTGLDVVDLGIAPTPLVYFYLFQHEVAGGVIVTGSHNPAEFNGFKLCKGKQTLYEKAIQEIRTTLESNEITSSSKRGRRRTTDILPDYLDILVTQFRPSGPLGEANVSIRVVVDAGNGTAGLVVPDLLDFLIIIQIQLSRQMWPISNRPWWKRKRTSGWHMTETQTGWGWSTIGERLSGVTGCSPFMPGRS
jgi:phosphomannomutase/phosphoglucomutase